MGRAWLDEEDVRPLGLVELGLDVRLHAGSEPASAKPPPRPGDPSGARLPPVGRVLLVRLLVAEAGVRVERVAEGAVVGRGVPDEARGGGSEVRARGCRAPVQRHSLCRVREDGDVGEALGVEGVADGADAAVHHIRGGNHVGPGKSM